MHTLGAMNKFMVAIAITTIITLALDLSCSTVIYYPLTACGCPPMVMVIIQAIMEEATHILA